MLIELLQVKRMCYGKGNRFILQKHLAQLLAQNTFQLQKNPCQRISKQQEMLYCFISQKKTMQVL